MLANLFRQHVYEHRNTRKLSSHTQIIHKGNKHIQHSPAAVASTCCRCDDETEIGCENVSE